MSYSPAFHPRSIASLGASATGSLCPQGYKVSCSDPSTCTCLECLEPKAWSASQKACNAQGGKPISTDPSDPCTLADAILTAPGKICFPPSSAPSQYPPDPCPSGQTLLSEKVPRQSTTGAWGTVSVSYCASSLSPAVAAQAYQRNWGLIIGLGVAAVVVYKIATG
jgi:hypothetical protein